MHSRSHRILPLAALVLGVVLAVPSPSQAGLVLTLDDLGTAGIDAIIVDDMVAGTATAKGTSNFADSSPVAGSVLLLGTVGSFTVNVTTGTSKPIVGSAGLARLDLPSVSLANCC